MSLRNQTIQVQMLYKDSRERIDTSLLVVAAAVAVAIVGANLDVD